MLIKPTSIFIFIFYFNSVNIFCQSNNYKTDSNRLVNSAFKILHTAMPAENFKQLNWNGTKVDTLPRVYIDTVNTILAKKYKLKKQIVSPVLKISCNQDSTKFILYSEQNGIRYYNWVQLQLTSDSNSFSGVVKTLSVNNNTILKSWQIKRGETITSQKIQSNINARDFGHNTYIESPTIVLISHNDSYHTPLISINLYHILFHESLNKYNILLDAYMLLDNRFNQLFTFPFGH